MQTYTWWDQVPETLKTKTALEKKGYKPGGPPHARIEYGRGRRHRTYDLYDIGAARLKQAATPTQLAALEHGRKVQAEQRAAAFQAEMAAEAELEAIEEAEREEMLIRDRDRAIRWARTVLKRTDLRILDTETTGIGAPYEIVQIGVMAIDGTVLFDRLVRPQLPIPAAATAIHGITDAMVAAAPTFAEIVDQLAAVLHGHPVAGYNVSFDTEMVRSELWRMYDGAMLPLEPETRWTALHEATEHWLCQSQWMDVMEPYAAFYGEWSDYHGSYRWQALSGSHQAVGDCQACLALLHEMARAPRSIEQPQEAAPSDVA